MNELIPMPVIVEGEKYDYCEEESADEVIGSLLAGVDGMELSCRGIISERSPSLQRKIPKQRKR